MEELNMKAYKTENAVVNASTPRRVLW